MAAAVGRSVPGKAQVIIHPSCIYILDHERLLCRSIQFPSEQFHIKVFRSDITASGWVVFACHSDFYRITPIYILFEFIGHIQGYFGSQTFHIHSHHISNGAHIRYRFKREIFLINFRHEILCSIGIGVARSAHGKVIGGDAVGCFRVINAFRIIVRKHRLHFIERFSIHEVIRFVEHRYHILRVTLLVQSFQHNDIVTRKFNVFGRGCRWGVATRPNITLCYKYTVCIIKVEVGVFYSLFIYSVLKVTFCRPCKGTCISEADIDICLVSCENTRCIIRNDFRFFVRACTQCGAYEQT